MGGGGGVTNHMLHLHNNNREFIGRFRRLKVLYNLKKNMQDANTYNIYTCRFMVLTSVLVHDIGN